MPKDSQISVMPLPFRYHSPYMYVFSPCRVSTRKSTKVFVKCPFTAPVFGQAAQEGKRGGTCRGCMCEHRKARGKCRECRGMEEAAGSREERAGRSEEEASREKVARTTQGLASRGSMQPRQVHGADRCGTQRHARVARGQGGAHCPGRLFQRRGRLLKNDGNT